MKNIKSIIFDLGGVLLNINYQNTINQFQKLGIQNASSFYSKQKQKNLFNNLECGKITESTFVRKIKKYCPNKNSTEIILAWNAMLLDLPKNRINLLENLQHKYQIFLLSNTNQIHINQFKNLIGYENYQKFYNLFNKVYYSHEIGFRKPNVEAFHLILDENNLKAKEVLFIDDSPQHIESAKKIGIHTYHLKDNEEVTSIFSDRFQ